MEIFKLFGSVFVDNEKANESISKTDSLGQKLATGFSNTVSAIGAGCVAMGAAAATTAVAAVKSFGDFEESLNKVATIADTSVMSVEDIKSGVIGLSNDMGIASGDINEAMYQAISATGDTANALKYVEGASKLAKGGFTDVSKAMDGVTKTMNAYGMSGEEAFQKVSDMLIQTQNLGITTVDELAGSLYNVIPTAASLGIEFDQVSAAMATMTSMGTPTSVATTQLKSAFAELSKEGTKSSDAFKELTNKSFKQFIEEGGTISEAMTIIADGARESGKEVGDMFGSLEAGAVALALTGDGATKFADSLASMQESAGATQAAYETMSEGVNASFGKLVNAGKNVMIQLGDKLAPLAVQCAEWINNHMPQIQALISKAFEIIGNVISGTVEIIQWLIDAFGKLLDQNNITSDTLNQIWTNISVMFQEVFNNIVELLKSFIEMFQAFWNQWGNTIMVYVKGLWEQIKIIFDTAFKALNSLLKIFTALFKGDWDGLWKEVKNLISIVWEGIKSLTKNTLNTLVEILKNIIPNMLQAGKDMINGVWDGMKSIWSNISNWVSDKVSWLADKLMFWRSSEKEMSSSSSGSSKGRSVDGSHANGLEYVPFDGYVAELHEGERVLTKDENNAYENQTPNIVINMYNPQVSDKSSINQTSRLIRSQIASGNRALGIK